uniref:Uncharacterized protein n=1 Tax=Ditylum brightwellii TaxID=49249 RepID=A0A7S2EF06_9STRA|mmetsp:Transcript_27735/g.41266  ORF Transcript_27735/g.41266 Transcript_27735/m.41266 type:complete len:245 (+) Transcript_27735:68-802(+)
MTIKSLLCSVTTLCFITWCPSIHSFSGSATWSRIGHRHPCTSAYDSSTTTTTAVFSSLRNEDKEDFERDSNSRIKRRFFVKNAATAAAAATLLGGIHLPANAAEKQLPKLLSQVKEAKEQLSPIPTLIKEEKWDAVRAILITPPLSDCWAKSSAARPILTNIATAIGDELPDGDELAALELREDLISHLRFLDMAVYNNVFNPIGSEGKSGATKELIRSYYEDPTNEFKATLKAFEELIQLAAN